MRPPLALPLALLISMLPSTAGADPWTRFSEDQAACEGLDCDICGVPYRCEGQSCTWGALTFDDLNTEDALHKGFLLYCLGGGGVALTAASSVGVQAATLSRTFDVLQRPAGRPRRTAGGVFEINNVGGGNKVYGVTIPLSWTFTLDPRSDIDAQGNVIVGGGSGLYQYGFNANPVYTRYVYGQGSDSWRVVAGGALPLQLVGTSGDGIDTGLSWLVGGGGFAGVSRPLGSSSLGAGVTMDIRYAGGLTVPMQLALRSAHDLSKLHSWLDQFVVQPGVSFDLAAGSSIGETVRIGLLVGLDLGDYVAGYYATFQGASSSHGFGVTYIGRAGRLAKGEGVRLQPTTQPITPPAPPASQPTPAPLVPASQPVPASLPASEPASLPTSEPTSLPAHDAETTGTGGTTASPAREPG